MLAYWEGFFKAQVPVPAGNVFLSPKPFITDYQMVLAILKLEFMLYIYIYIGNFVHIDEYQDCQSGYMSKSRQAQSLPAGL